MRLTEGSRATFTVTGTVISDSDFLEGMANLPDALPGERDVTNLRLDNGVIVRFDSTDDEIGVPMKVAQPRYWPPVINDVWVDDQDGRWYATEMDFGYRTGLRLKSYTDLGETVRSAGYLLSNNTKLSLLIRGGEFVGN